MMSSRMILNVLVVLAILVGPVDSSTVSETAKREPKISVLEQDFSTFPHYLISSFPHFPVSSFPHFPILLISPCLRVPASPCLDIRADRGYHWVQAIASGQGQWPQSNMPIAAFNNRLWMVQDSRFVWSSDNGIRWVKLKSNAGWGGRYLHSVAFFDNKLWVMGGRVGPVRGDDYRNDVWYSTDGADWRLATSNAGWSPRANHQTLVFDQKLWVIGGGRRAAANDIWSSPDGVHWTQVTTSIPWSPRFARAFFVFQNKIWVIGFRSGNDAWHTTDGEKWTSATADTGGPPNLNRAGAIVFDEKIWAMGGIDDRGNFLNDVWYSTDGVRWVQAMSPAPWSPRATNYSVVFDHKLWIYGGKNAKGDVWYMAPRKSDQ